VFVVQLRAKPQRYLAVVGVLIVASIIIMSNFWQSDAASLISQRYLSSFKDASGRLEQNGILPATVIIERYAMMGEGLGFFTLGSGSWGGRQLWDFIATRGVSEDSWLRFIAETGLFGLAVYAWLYFSLMRRAIAKVRRSTSGSRRGLAWFALLWLLSIGMWSVTHDVLANSVGMSIGLGLCGSILLRQEDVGRGVQV